MSLRDLGSHRSFSDTHTRRGDASFVVSSSDLKGLWRPRYLSQVVLRAMQSAAASGDLATISGELARSRVSIGGRFLRGLPAALQHLIQIIYHPVVVQLELWIGRWSGCIRQGEISGLINETAPPRPRALQRAAGGGVLSLALAHVSPTLPQPLGGSSTSRDTQRKNWNYTLR